MGAFLQTDTIWSTNSYAYVKNNPIYFIDPSGSKENAVVKASEKPPILQISWLSGPLGLMGKIGPKAANVSFQAGLIEKEVVVHIANDKSSVLPKDKHMADVKVEIGANLGKIGGKGGLKTEISLDHTYQGEWSSIRPYAEPSVADFTKDDDFTIEFAAFAVCGGFEVKANPIEFVRYLWNTYSKYPDRSFPSPRP